MTPIINPQSPPSLKSIVKPPRKQFQTQIKTTMIALTILAILGAGLAAGLTASGIMPLGYGLAIGMIALSAIIIISARWLTTKHPKFDPQVNQEPRLCAKDYAKQRPTLDQGANRLETETSLEFVIRLMTQTIHPTTTRGPKPRGAIDAATYYLEEKIDKLTQELIADPRITPEAAATRIKDSFLTDIKIWGASDQTESISYQEFESTKKRSHLIKKFGRTTSNIPALENEFKNRSWLSGDRDLVYHPCTSADLDLLERQLGTFFAQPEVLEALKEIFELQVSPKNTANETHVKENS